MTLMVVFCLTVQALFGDKRGTRATPSSVQGHAGAGDLIQGTCMQRDCSAGWST